MKPIQSLTRQVDQWRQTYADFRRFLSSRVSDLSAIDNQSGDQKPGIAMFFKQSVPNPPPRTRKNRPAVMWILGTVSLTSSIGNRFYNQPNLDVGKAAPQTIQAPFEANVEDRKTTEEKRKSARNGFDPVLMLNVAVTQEIHEDLQKSLKQGQTLRDLVGPFPFVKTSTISESTQRYLRQAEVWEWQRILTILNSDEAINSSQPEFQNPNVQEKLSQAATQSLLELQAYRRLSSPQTFSFLIDTISVARQRYADAVSKLSEPLAAKSSHHYDASLFQLSDEEWQLTSTDTNQVAERILTQGIPPGLPTSLLEKAIKIQLNSPLPQRAESLATQILLAILKPNLIEDKEQTKLRAEQAAQAVATELVSVRQGEVIVYAGQTIHQKDFVLLDYFGLSRRSVNWVSLIGFGVLVSGAVGVFWLVEKQVYPSLRRRDNLLVLLLTLSTPLLVSLGVPYPNLPAVGLLVGSFYGSALGVIVVALLAGLGGIGTAVSWESWLIGAVGGMLGGLIAGRLRSREELALLGGAVGLTQGTIYLIVTLILSGSAGSVWYTILQEAAACGFSGLAWSIVAFGLSPYLEQVFDLVTPIRLAELSNPNRPLLKRLATETPGTFQHTLFVATLAEAAARQLGGNVELVRAGTLYHDIGKMHDPLGFIENQMGRPNKHDEINDPWKSAQIIKKHVSEGLLMARKHRLPKAIKAFIPEHQGTILIAYFYYQAQQLAEASQRGDGEMGRWGDGGMGNLINSSLVSSP